MNIISKTKLRKLVLLGVSLILLFNFISCGKESPTGPEEPEKPTAIEGKVVGLIKGQPVKLSSVELCHDSGYVIDTCLVEGNTFRDDDVNNPQLAKRIRIRSDEAYDRETDLRLTIGANNVFEFDIVESYKPLDEYRIVGRTVSPRWTDQFTVYIYDRSLFHGLEIKGTFEPSQKNMNRIINVIQNDILKITNFVSNPKIEKESEGYLPPPRMDAEGYVIIHFCDDIYNLRTGHLHSNFHIYNGLVSITSHVSDIPRGPISQDICEPMGYIDTLKKCDSIFGPDYCLPSKPTGFDIDAGKFKYSRPHKNKTQGNIPDYDPVGSGTSGLLLHKIEPIYELNPLNQFNQFQKPTFTLPKDKIHKKQRLNKDLK